MSDLNDIVAGVKNDGEECAYNEGDDLKKEAVVPATASFAAASSSQEEVAPCRCFSCKPSAVCCETNCPFMHPMRYSIMERVLLQNGVSEEVKNKIIAEWKEK